MERVWPEVEDIAALRERAAALGIDGAGDMDKETLTRAVAGAQREAEAMTVAEERRREA